MSRWVQEKKKTLATHRLAALRAGQSPSDFNEAASFAQIDGVDGVVSSIPANITAQRAIECGSYARALFHWEHFVREQSHRPQNVDLEERDAMYQRLQTIYTQIDEPDGLEGISAKLNILSPEQQALQHRRAGRWSAAQSWYEIESMQKPDDRELQLGLLSCLKESGQYSKSCVYPRVVVSDSMIRSSSSPCFRVPKHGILQALTNPASLIRQRSMLDDGTHR